MDLIETIYTVRIEFARKVLARNTIQTIKVEILVTKITPYIVTPRVARIIILSNNGNQENLG